MRMIDNNAFTAIYMEYAAEITNLMYSLSLLKSQAAFNVSINRTKNTTASFTETGLGGSFGYNQGWLEGKVNINGTVAIQLSDVNTNYSFNLGGNYTMDKRHNLGANIFFLNNKSDHINSQNFTELTGVFRYTINF